MDIVCSYDRQFNVRVIGNGKTADIGICFYLNLTDDHSLKHWPKVVLWSMSEIVKAPEDRQSFANARFIAGVRMIPYPSFATFDIRNK